MSMLAEAERAQLKGILAKVGAGLGMAGETLESKEVVNEQVATDDRYVDSRHGAGHAC
jgi:hypothetical protein